MPTEENYLYKIEIEMDDQKIIADNDYDIADIYRIIRLLFANENIAEIPNDRGVLIFASCNEDNKELSRFTIIEGSLIQREWFMNYVKKMHAYINLPTEVADEDLLVLFKDR